MPSTTRPPPSLTWISAKDKGAVGDYNPKTGVGTDDRTAFSNAILDCIARGKDLVIPPGTYFLSKYVLINGARGLNIYASGGVTIYFGSDTLTTIYDATALSYNQARSAFLVKNSRDVRFHGITFVGGSTSEISNVNVGCGIYASRVVGLRVTDCTLRNGASLIQQDSIANTKSSLGNTLTNATGVVTLANNGDANFAFHQGMVNGYVTISNATNPVNNGIFPVLEVVSSTQLRYTNAAAVTESPSDVTYECDDGDRDTIVDGGRWDGARSASYVGSHSGYSNCTFERPQTPDRTGIPIGFRKPTAWAASTAYAVGDRRTNSGNTYEVTIAGTSAGAGGPTGTGSAIVDNTVTWKYVGGGTVVLMPVFGAVDLSLRGKRVIIAGSTSAGNNGTFPILHVTPATVTSFGSIQFANASSVTELAAQADSTWIVPNGEKVGLGNGASAISNASGVVTFTASAAIFQASDVDKALRLVSATTIANRGSFVITRFVSSTVVEYVNTGAVTEAFSGVFTVDGYDSRRGDSAVGPAISSTSTGTSATPSLTDSTLTMVTNAYAGRYLADSAGRQWKIVSNTGTVFTLAGTGTPASGAYTVTAGATYGSSHGIYLFAGRTNVTIHNCKFRGVRTECIKVSGSALPIRDIDIGSNIAIDCGAFAIVGADDSQEHSSINVHHNHVTDCGGGRVGYSTQWAIGILGARNVKVCDNQIHATRDAVSQLTDGASVAGLYGIFCGRYLAGISQPLVDLTCDRNTLTIDARSCKHNRVASSAIFADRVGQVSKWRTASGGAPISLTYNAADDNKVTLTDAFGQFSQSDVGSTIRLVNFASAGNNVTATVTDVLGTGSLKFINATGVTVSGSTVGTYVTKPKALNVGQRSSTCSISKNQIAGYGGNGITTVACLGPELVGNIFSGVGQAFVDDGSVGFRVVGSREVAPTTSNARIQISSKTSWPFFDDNVITNGSIAGGNTNLDGVLLAARTDMGIGVDSTTPIDYPLCGKRGRMRSTQAKPEVVISFGSEWVDGDSVEINGVAYTYKTASPGANQFNSQASLMALVGSGFVAEDYGTGLTGAPTTGHIRIRTTATSATADLGYVWRVNTANPTACVTLFNDVAGGEAISYSRGEGIAGPLAKRFVVWSPACQYSAGVMVMPDESTAATLMADGWYHEKASKNAGSCEVIRSVTTHANTEELRWMIA